MKLAFFDTKPYDKPGFDEHSAGTDIEIKYFETRLGEDTVQLAHLHTSKTKLILLWELQKKSIA